MYEISARFDRRDNVDIIPKSIGWTLIPEISTGHHNHIQALAEMQGLFIMQ